VNMGIKLSIKHRAWDILKSRGEMRGSDLGWELWGETTDCANRGTGSHRHNKFCRAAGKILRHLEKQGRVISVPRKRHTVWRAVGNNPP